MWWDKAQDALGILLRRHSAGEVHGSCPKCGGDDRLIVWIHGKYWCRQCQFTGMWLGEDEAKEERRRYQAQRRQRERQAELDLMLNGQAIWRIYHEACLANPDALAAWEESGIVESDIRKWGLGYCGSCPSYPDSPSLTIPVWWNAKLHDLRHRLLKPPEDGGKYRTEFPGVMPHLFNLDRVKGRRFLVVEGEKKVIVLERFGFPAVGLPGAAYGIESLLIAVQAQAKKCEIVIAFDPGAEAEAYKIGDQLEKTDAYVRIADCPWKPDDQVLQYGVGLTREILRQSRPVRVDLGSENARKNIRHR